MKLLYQYLLDHAEKKPDSTFIKFKSETFTFREIADKVNSFAVEIRKSGLVSKQRVGILLPNIPEFIVSYYGIIRAGGIAVLLPTAISTRELKCLIKKTNISFLIYSEEYKEQVEELKGEGFSFKKIIVGSAIPGILSFNDLVSSRLRFRAIYNITEHDDAVVLFSAGYSDLPKAVVLSHNNIISDSVAFSEYLPGVRGHVFLSGLPLSNSFAHTITMNGALILGEVILLMEDTSLESISEIISRGEVTILVDTPERFDSLYTKIDFEETNLKIGITVGQSLSDKTVEKWERNRNFQFIETYGLAEASPVVSVNLNGYFENCFSIGLPLSCNQVNVIDENGADTKIGELGELQVKGKNVAKYYNGGEMGFYLGEQSWLSTGDIVKCSATGDYCFECKKSDLIDKYGYKISPKSIEEVIYRHNKVGEVVVVGVPGSSVGQHIKACIIPKANEELDRDEIFDYTEENLPKYLNPDMVVFYKEFPRDQLGRVDRKALTKS